MKMKVKNPYALDVKALCAATIYSTSSYSTSVPRTLLFERVGYTFLYTTSFKKTP